MGALKGPAVADNPESRKIPNSVQAVVVVVVVYDARVLRWWCRCRSMDSICLCLCLGGGNSKVVLGRSTGSLSMAGCWLAGWLASLLSKAWKAPGRFNKVRCTLPVQSGYLPPYPSKWLPCFELIGHCQVPRYLIT